MAKPLAIFKDKDGTLVEVFNAIDVKEWEAAGYKAEPEKKGRPAAKSKTEEIYGVDPKNSSGDS